LVGQLRSPAEAGSPRAGGHQQEQAERQSGTADHDQDHAHVLEVDALDVRRDRPLEDRAEGDQEETRTDRHTDAVRPLAPRHNRYRAAAAGDGRVTRDPIFVVQQHSARTQHYDLRLEIGGVLASWAVPKGPSMDPRDKRLAIRVEDHELDYADFEGIIPAREYGAGAVIVWDRGIYRNRTRRDGEEVPADRALQNGHLVVELRGEKLRGGFALTRTGTDARGRERWLLVKKRDAEAAAAGQPVLSRPESVLSGRTIEQLAAETGWSSTRR
jgi:DNA ligase D-like protein (predicted 3'-phosphoesterase)